MLYATAVDYDEDGLDSPNKTYVINEVHQIKSKANGHSYPKPSQ